MSCSPSTTTTTTSPAASSSTIVLASMWGETIPARAARLTVRGTFPAWIGYDSSMADRLERYREKRDPGATPEPTGDARAPATPEGAPRFVVHEHHARRLHWDLRLEHEGALASWAVPRGIPAHPDENRLAVRTEDHPLEYLEFEGDIPKGEYGAGTMRIWDRGTYRAEKLRDDEVIASFDGERLNGRYALFRTGGKNWMIHRISPPLDPEREPMPGNLRPMLPRRGSLPPDQDAYGFEIAWGGLPTPGLCEPGPN